ncbi:hypothetical protein [Legionella tunisiensis]|uniref:hypothetical protein n=1 Tax=Legionella tunisiensis TaxID=1034944 RepID=UPI0012EA7419|nr:hypothetical protein [Legionella tunisiensis]
MQDSIVQQQKAFSSIFGEVHTNLGKYKLSQEAISAIKRSFDTAHDAPNEDEEDEITFYQQKLKTLQGITRQLEEEKKQAKTLIANTLIQKINAVALEIDTKRLEMANKTEGYTLLENEAAFVRELKTPLARDYQQSVDQAELEEHLEILLVTKENLTAESEKRIKL